MHVGQVGIFSFQLEALRAHDGGIGPLEYAHIIHEHGGGQFVIVGRLIARHFAPHGQVQEQEEALLKFFGPPYPTSNPEFMVFLAINIGANVFRVPLGGVGVVAVDRSRTGSLGTVLPVAIVVVMLRGMGLVVGIDVLHDVNFPI